MTGASFTGCTVSRKLDCPKLPSESVTVSMTSALPYRFVAGRRVTVLFVPSPPKKKLLCGSRSGSEEDAVTTKAVAGVSVSPKEKKKTAGGGASSLGWSGVLENNRASFTGSNGALKVVCAETPPTSLNVHA